MLPYSATLVLTYIYWGIKSSIHRTDSAMVAVVEASSHCFTVDIHWWNEGKCQPEAP